MVTMSRLNRDFQWAIVGKIVKSWKKVEFVVRMKDDRLPEKIYDKERDGCRKNEEDHGYDGRIAWREIWERRRKEKSGEKKPTTGRNGRK